MATLNPVNIPLIDRQNELNRLKSITSEVLDAAAGRLVTVQGSRGVGKSRVISTFASWCGDQGMTVLFAQCVGSAAEPLLPIKDALLPALGSTARAIRAALRRSAPDLLDGVPFLGKFLAGFGRELAAGPQIGGDGPLGLYEVLSSVVVRLGSGQGVCFIIEDAHMADPDTLSFLTYLFNKSRNWPTLTIVTLPSEERQSQAVSSYLAEWSEKGCETLTIRPLERDPAREFVITALGKDSLPALTLDFLFHFTGGNPLLLGESIRELADRDGDLSNLPTGPTEIPERIRRLLEWRLQRLDGPTRSFVDTAAVVGETSHELAPILHVLGVDELAGLDTLSRACDAGIVNEDAQGRITFTSELLHMVTHSQLRPNYCRSLHLRAGGWFEAEQRFSEAAHHYERAENWPLFLPAAFRAAEAAEHVGLYLTSLTWYRRVQGRADPAELFPRMARALMVVGDWHEAERVVDMLSANSPQTLMLRSQLCFVRGDIVGAADYANHALRDDAIENIDVLLRLANIELYSGRFAPAAEYAERALLAARESGSVRDQARSHIVRGACHLYNGFLEAAIASFQNGIWLLDSVPSEHRDTGVYSALLGNRGFVEEIEQRWEDAERSHREALRLHRAVADAVGVLASTLAIGRVCLGQGDLEQSAAFLADAFRQAEDLGEDLQKAKIVHSRGLLASKAGDNQRARELVEDARAGFVKCGTSYDIAYTDLSLARILSQAHHMESIERLASGRAATERGGFTLLRRLFPEVEPGIPDRIHAGLLAYAVGDAFGLPWEGKPPGQVRMAELDTLPKPEAWPAGSTSDDTALTLLVAEHLAAAGGKGDPLRFLERLAAQAGSIHGLGPSTRRAIETFTATGKPDDSGSNTNGAPMRALPVGWSLPVSASDQRRQWTLELTRMTHTGHGALTAACAMSACAAWALEGASPALLVETAAAEAQAVGAGTVVAVSLATLRAGNWRPPANGISLSPAETVSAVLYCCQQADGDLDAALRLAVSLGGDTDTVAALVGGLLGCRLAPAEVSARLPWLGRAMLPPADSLERLGGALAAIRLAADG